MIKNKEKENNRKMSAEQVADRCIEQTKTKEEADNLLAAIYWDVFPRMADSDRETIRQKISAYYDKEL